MISWRQRDMAMSRVENCLSFSEDILSLMEAQSKCPRTCQDHFIPLRDVRCIQDVHRNAPESRIDACLLRACSIVFLQLILAHLQAKLLLLAKCCVLLNIQLFARRVWKSAKIADVRHDEWHCNIFGRDIRAELILHEVCIIRSQIIQLL